MTTVNDLIEALQDAVTEHGPGLGDAPVRLAIQPTWPFEHALGDICVVERWEQDQERLCDSPLVLYLGDSDQVGYLPGDAREVLGWQP
ncbi:hypothetical protein FZ103_10580 [Streptomonospora sp. PA3]|uniref:hypothetical protein n=1 Tax=Streptomonospora sp. PA3 TaxID=2607326 RepID=UPI0012DBE0E5|nr:hypothetical protein [Streptomonospora sp. PA3]MUL41616.1 hypothetical protein [Streptomonospora sp. PA3]